MLKKILYTLLVLILLLTIGMSVFLFTKRTKYSGEEKINGLTSQVEIYYDNYGIPHIFAQNNQDAMLALGYVQAKDRLFQMEILSRIAQGRLSEIFGNKLLEVDKFFLSLGIDENSEKIVNELDKNSEYYKQASYFLDGVNQYMQEGNLPLEFSVLGIKRHEFTLKDIHNILGYMSFGFAMAHKTDPLASAIKEKLGDQYVEQLGLKIDPKTTLIKTFSEEESLKLSKSMSYIEKHNPIPAFIGSNSWVISPEKTKNGKVIFENDPHIGYSQPGTWFQAHIKTPEFESYGFYLALTPYPLLAHNRQLAYGLTMFENDDIDLYIEKTNPDDNDYYLLDNSYKKFSKRNYKIPVKGEKEVEFTVLNTHRGPVINDVIPEVKEQKPVSMYWVYMHRPNKLLEIIYNMSRASNIEEFKKNPPMLHAPGLNIMYGDVQGNVAWWASGHLYERKNNPQTKMLLDGSVSINDSIKYLSFSINPQAINPQWKYVYSCNNQPDSLLSKRYIPGYYLPQDRAKRVVALLESKNDWTQADVENMANDITSPVYLELNALLINNLENKKLSHIEAKALLQLKKWNGKAETNSVGITLFNQFIYEYYKATLYDEIGEEMFKQILNTHLGKRLLEPMMKGHYPIWIDDISTKKIIENQEDIQLKAFQNAVAKLKHSLSHDVATWTWDKVHTVEYKHPFGEIKLLRPFFNVGPFPIVGTNEVLNNQIFDLSDSYKMDVKAGPSTRRIIDFSDVENAKAIVPTGNSGNVMSKHYKDQTQLFLDGKYIPMLINEQKIRASKNKIILRP